MTRLGVYCPTCDEETLPLPNGWCGWCDSNITHGTRGMYQSGCRCSECRLAQKVYNLARRTAA